jgi:hypothetical protein
VHGAVVSYGEIDFASFQDFLIGNSDFSALGTGFSRLDLRTNDYHLFAQDDWKVTPRITLGLGLRYELNAPPYETHGTLGGFDPTLYQPRMEIDQDNFPVGPPAGGIIEAGNAPAQYSLPGVTRVGNRVLKSVDPFNFAPRVGIAWSPLSSDRLVVHGGYGIFYSRPSFLYVGLNYFAPPFFQISAFGGQPLQDPFPGAPPSNSFPVVQTGIPLAATVVDRNNHNPYYQHFNAGVQYELIRDTVVQAAYAGSRGLRLLRSLPVNQARIASQRHPIVNPVTGETFTTNTFQDAALRAPLQGVDTGAFSLNQSSAQSTYHSLQATLNRRMSRGLQVSLSYTFSKSIDNASNPGGGANLDGTQDRGGGIDTGNLWGNVLDPHANRGLSDFDRPHVLAFTFIWNLPDSALSRKLPGGRAIFSNWQISATLWRCRACRLISWTVGEPRSTVCSVRAPTGPPERTRSTPSATCPRATTSILKRSDGRKSMKGKPFRVPTTLRHSRETPKQILVTLAATRFVAPDRAISIFLWPNTSRGANIERLLSGSTF